MYAKLFVDMVLLKVLLIVRYMPYPSTIAIGVLINRIKGKDSMSIPPSKLPPRRMLIKTMTRVKIKAKILGCSITTFACFSLLKKFKRTRFT